MKNEIDHCLSDIGRLESDYLVLSRFEFSSDHKRSKYKNKAGMEGVLGPEEYL